MPKVNELEKNLQPGQIYRRADLTKWSNAVDRHLQQLVSNGVIQKLAGGLYYCPRKTAFGNVPPGDEILIRAFLKDDHFYMASLNSYNSLGLGTTQLYNEKLVYNHKRDGKITLNGRQFYFLKRSRFPEKSSQEFLLVDLINNLHLLAEDKESIMHRVTEKVKDMDKACLTKNIQEYAGVRTQKFFETLFHSKEINNAF
jgi:hypothetical protein